MLLWGSRNVVFRIKMWDTANLVVLQADRDSPSTAAVPTLSCRRATTVTNDEASWERTVVAMIRQRCIERSRRRMFGVVVGFSLIAAACSGGGSDDSGASTIVKNTKAPPAASSSVAPGIADQVASSAEYGDPLAEVRSGVVYPGFNETITSDMVDLSVASAPSIDSYQGLLVVAEGVSIDVATELSAPLLVRVALPPPPNDSAIPAVLHVTDSGEYRVEPGVWDAESNTIAVWAHSFSDRFGGWWNPANWVEEVVQVGQGGFDFLADWVTGRTDPPPCEESPPDWASVSTVEASALHVCLQSNPADDGAERVELFLKSNRATMQLVSFPNAADFVWVDNQPEEIRRILVQAATGEYDSQQVLLLGGQSMSYGLRRPSAPVEFETRTTQTPTVVIANQALGLLGGIQGDGATAVVLAIGACVLEATGVDLIQADVVPTGYDSLPEFAGAMVRCGFELLSEPDAIVAIADESLLSTGVDVVTRNDVIGRVRSVTDKIAPLAGRLIDVVNVGGAVVRAVDGELDNKFEGLITVSLEGPPTVPPNGVNPVDRGTVLSATLPPTTCGWIVEATGLQLFDGVTPPAPGGEEISAPVDDLNRVVFGDLDGDGVEDAAIVLDCYGGGNAIWNEVVVLIAGQSPYIVGWDTLTSAPGVPAGVSVNALTLFEHESGLGINWYGELPEDPRCCPSVQFDTYLSVAPTTASVTRTIGIDPLTGDPFEL